MDGLIRKVDDLIVDIGRYISYNVIDLPESIRHSYGSDLFSLFQLLNDHLEKRQLDSFLLKHPKCNKLLSQLYGSRHEYLLDMREVSRIGGLEILVSDETPMSPFGLSTIGNGEASRSSLAHIQTPSSHPRFTAMRARGLEELYELGVASRGGSANRPHEDIISIDELMFMERVLVLLQEEDASEAPIATQMAEDYGTEVLTPRYTREQVQESHVEEQAEEMGRDKHAWGILMEKTALLDSSPQYTQARKAGTSEGEVFQTVDVASRVTDLIVEIDDEDDDMSEGPNTPIEDEITPAALENKIRRSQAVDTSFDVQLHPYMGFNIEPPRIQLARAKNFLADQDADRTVGWRNKFAQLSEYFAYLWENYDGEDWGYDLMECVDMLRSHWVYEDQHYAIPPLTLDFVDVVPQESTRLPKLPDFPIVLDRPNQPHVLQNLNHPRFVPAREVGSVHDEQYRISRELLVDEYLGNLTTGIGELWGSMQQADALTQLGANGDGFSMASAENASYELCMRGGLRQTARHLEQDAIFVHSTGEDSNSPTPEARMSFASFRGAKRAALQQCLSNYDNLENFILCNPWKTLTLPNTTASPPKIIDIFVPPKTVPVDDTGYPLNVPREQSRDPFAHARWYCWFRKEQKHWSSCTRGHAIKEAHGRKLWLKREEPVLDVPLNFKGPVTPSLRDHAMQATLNKLRRCRAIHQALRRSDALYPREFVHDLLTLIDHALRGEGWEEVALEFNEHELVGDEQTGGSPSGTRNFGGTSIDLTAAGKKDKPAHIRAPEFRWLEFLTKVVPPPAPSTGASLSPRGGILADRVTKLLADKDPKGLFRISQTVSQRELLDEINRFCGGGRFVRHEFTMNDLTRELPKLHKQNIIHVDRASDGSREFTVQPPRPAILPEQRIRWHENGASEKQGKENPSQDAMEVEGGEERLGQDVHVVPDENAVVIDLPDVESLARENTMPRSRVAKGSGKRKEQAKSADGTPPEDSSGDDFSDDEGSDADTFSTDVDVPSSHDDSECEKFMPDAKHLRTLGETPDEDNDDYLDDQDSTESFYHNLAFRLGLTMRELQAQREEDERNLSVKSQRQQNKMFVKYNTTAWEYDARVRPNKEAQKRGPTLGNRRVTPFYTDILRAADPSSIKPKWSEGQPETENAAMKAVQRGVLRELSENKSMIWPVRQVLTGRASEENPDGVREGPLRREPVWSFGHLKTGNRRYWDMNNWPPKLQTEARQKEIRARWKAPQPAVMRQRRREEPRPEVGNSDAVSAEVEPDASTSYDISYNEHAMQRRTFKAGSTEYWDGDTPLQRRTLEKWQRARFETRPAPTWRQAIGAMFREKSRVEDENPLSLSPIHPRHIRKSVAAREKNPEEDGSTDDDGDADMLPAFVDA